MAEAAGLGVGLTVFAVQLDCGGTGGGGSSSARVALLLLIGVGVLGGLVWWLPSLHRRGVPQLRAAGASVRTVVTDPRRLAMVVGGNFGSQVLYAVVLGLSVRAYGAHLTLGTLLV